VPGLDGAFTVHVNSFSCPAAMLSPGMTVFRDGAFTPG